MRENASRRRRARAIGDATHHLELVLLRIPQRRELGLELLTDRQFARFPIPNRRIVRAAGEFVQQLEHVPHALPLPAGRARHEHPGHAARNLRPLRALVLAPAPLEVLPLPHDDGRACVCRRCVPPSSPCSERRQKREGSPEGGVCGNGGERLAELGKGVRVRPALALHAICRCGVRRAVTPRRITRSRGDRSSKEVGGRTFSSRHAVPFEGGGRRIDGPPMDHALSWRDGHPPRSLRPRSVECIVRMQACMHGLIHWLLRVKG